MAGNDWINGYLDAILDADRGAASGGGEAEAGKTSLLLRERGHFSPARYFVEEVITGYDETDLYKTWLRAAAMRSPQERNTRLENMTWRIWNLARKKKQIEKEEAKLASKQHFKIDSVRREAVADVSEDLSEGEKEHEGNDSYRDGSGRGRIPRILSMDAISDWHNINSRMSSADASADSASQLNNRVISSDDFADWASELKEKKLYIALISIHGLIRGNNMELGHDSDTGGQVKYVVELARALGSSPGVYRVDLLTRKISAPDVHESYSNPKEMLSTKASENLVKETGKNSGAYIVRIPFGPKDKYIQKEHLWQYTQEFVDCALSHIKQMSQILGEEIGSGQPVWPIAIHGHYADAGDSAALLAGALNVPMVFTGHSLGRDKLAQFLKQGRQTREEINDQYKIMRRIEAEELALDTSEIIITSTRQEIEQQWSLYDGFDLNLARKLKARIRRGVSCYGRHMPRMVIIPPGMEFKHVVVYDDNGNEDVKDVSSGSSDPEIWSEIMQFLNYPRKPMILALARPDPKKNLTTLVKAFGECSRLRELANLVLIMGNRDDLDEMSATNAAYLISIFKLIDNYDLYGQVAYPKHHKQSEVPDIYRLAAKTKGVFINPAFIEPFGLTLIEAAAYGLPVVATKNGGPVDILQVLENGILVHPHDPDEIADALYKLVSDKQLWKTCRENGLKNIHQFSWPEHCKNYLSRIISIKQRHPQWTMDGKTDDNSGLDSLGGSSDIQDITLRIKISLDDGKPEDGDDQGIPLDEEEHASNGNASLDSSELTNGSARAIRKKDCEERNDLGSNAVKQPTFRQRKYIFVISVDSVNKENFIQVMKSILETTHEGRPAGSIGLVLSTSLTIAEVHSLLTSAGMLPSDLDAFICNSGSDLYYPFSCTDSSTEIPFVIDMDYHSQIEYRWGGEGLRKTLLRWAASIKEKKGETEEQLAIEDQQRSSTYCFALKVLDSEKLPPVHELRRLMRIQALRCHIIYNHDCTRLLAIPVLASRCQALRYLYVRWGIELSNIVVFVGESGDTDYEGLLGGLHKTIILGGSFNNAPNKLLAARSYPLHDVVAFDSANIMKTEGCSTNDIKQALQQYVF